MNKHFSMNDNIDFKQYFKIAYKYWYIFLIFSIIGLSITYWQLRYAVPLYNLSGSLQINDKNSDQSYLKDMDLFSSTPNVTKELEVLRSYSMVESALKQLDMPFRYFDKGNIRDVEYYTDSPIKLQYDSSFILTNVFIYIKIIDSSNFSLSMNYSGSRPYDMSTYKYVDTIISPINVKDHKYKFDEKISFGIISFKIKKNYEDAILIPDKEYFIVSQDIEDQTYEALNKLSVVITNKEASLIGISSVGSNKQKEADFINKLMDVYLQKRLEKENQIASNTIAFIDVQLLAIADSLNFAENKLERFKSKNKVFNIDIVANTSYAKLMDLEQNKSELELQNKYYEYLESYVNSERPFNEVVAPSTVNINDPLLIKLVSELVNLYEEKNTIVMTSSDRSPAYKTLVLRIKAAKEALLENVDNIVHSSQIALKDINERIKANEQTLSTLPSQERDFINIQRHFSLNDGIYNYLLQKRAEASIAKASSLPDAQIINAARIRDAYKISPIATSYYSIALFTVLVLSIAFLIIMQKYFDNKISSIENIEKVLDIPIIGSIAIITSKAAKGASPYIGYSTLIESFRSIRVNMQYICPGNESKVMGITSCVSGDGKSFTCINLAKVYAMTGKKVLLISADLRKKMNAKDYGIEVNENGLSDYLISTKNLNSFIHKSDIENVSVVPSGNIPPNAAELLASDRMKELFKEARKMFDIVILDSSPAGIISDYLTLLPFIDVNVFVIRMEHTPKQILPALQYIKDVNVDQKHCIIVNGIKKNSTYYGYYGYGNYGYAK